MIRTRRQRRHPPPDGAVGIPTAAYRVAAARIGAIGQPQADLVTLVDRDGDVDGADVPPVREGCEVDPVLHVGIPGLQAERPRLARELERYAGEIDLDPEQAAALDERVDLLESLKRKYGPGLEDVVESADSVVRN